MKQAPIKICFVLPEAYPYFNPKAGQMTGGAELQFYLLSTELAKNEHYNICFIVGDYHQAKSESVKKVKLIKSFNAKRSDGLFKKLKQTLHFFNIIKKLKPDILISTTNNTLVVLCSLYSKFSKAKHIHRIAHNKDTGFERKNEFGILAQLYSWGMKKADRVLVQNFEQQEQLLTNFDKQSVSLRNAFPVKDLIESKKSYILWVARYQSWKQPDLFIELAEKIPGEKFLMICPPPKGKKVGNWEKLKAKAEQLSNLQFIDYVPFSQIQDYFNNAQVLVNTSKAEGFPNTFLQAAQSKAAIVSLNVNPNDFISKFDCGIFCHNDFKLLVENLTQLVKNKDQLRKLGENGYTYLKENHDLKVVSNELISIINSVNKKTLIFPPLRGTKQSY